MKHRKKVAAAIAAVLKNINDSESQKNASEEQRPKIMKCSARNSWAHSGSQAQMHLRTMMQMRAFRYY